MSGSQSKVSAAFDAGQASVRRWWAIQRWIIVSIGVFTAMGSTCLLASGVFAYVLRLTFIVHLLAMREGRYLLCLLCSHAGLSERTLFAFPVSLQHFQWVKRSEVQSYADSSRQHALTAEEERILTSRLISLCLITVLCGGVLFPVSLLSGGLRWRSFADGRE